VKRAGPPGLGACVMAVLQELERIAPGVVVPDPILRPPTVLDTVEFVRSNIRIPRLPKVGEVSPGSLEGLSDRVSKGGSLATRAHRWCGAPNASWHGFCCLGTLPSTPGSGASLRHGLPGERMEALSIRTSRPGCASVPSPARRRHPPARHGRGGARRRLRVRRPPRSHRWKRRWVVDQGRLPRGLVGVEIAKCRRIEPARLSQDSTWDSRAWLKNDMLVLTRSTLRAADGRLGRPTAAPLFVLKPLS